MTNEWRPRWGAEGTDHHSGSRKGFLTLILSINLFLMQALASDFLQSMNSRKVFQ